MKPLRVVAATVLATATALALASPAGAVEETIGSCMVETIAELGGAEALEADIEAGEAEGASDEAKDRLKEIEEELELCLEAPNPIFPEVNEIIWGGLAFFVLLGIMYRFGFPAVSGAMQRRTERIRDDLEGAETAREEAEAIKAQHEAELADAKAQAAKIFDDARHDAAVMKADLQARAESDIADMRQRAEAEVAAARQRAVADLQSEVSEIVIGAAERVVERNLDPAAHQHLIDEYIQSVGSQ